MESYRTEEEQVEALRHWWRDNGRSTIVAIIVALGLGFGYQGFQQYRQGESDAASELYQRMLQAFNAPALSQEQRTIAEQLALQLKADYAGSTYAQFAAMHLARVAVADNDLAAAQEELRWVLGKADKGSDMAQVAQLRLARVLAASGEMEQALAILDDGTEGPYKASYAVARGDILLSQGRREEASAAFSSALELAGQDEAGIDLVVVEQKLRALNPSPARATLTSVDGSLEVEALPADGAVDAAGSMEQSASGEEG